MLGRTPNKRANVSRLYRIYAPRLRRLSRGHTYGSATSTRLRIRRLLLHEVDCINYIRITTGAFFVKLQTPKTKDKFTFYDVKYMEPDFEFLKDRIFGCLLGGAIGNAMGSPVENWDYKKIERTYGLIDMPLLLDKIVTEDDNRIAMLYIEGYLKYRRHYTPEEFAEIWLEKFNPGKEFFWCLRNAYELLKKGVHPRQTGLYNINTGSALMAIAPVGVYNMLDPERAWSDALELAYMYQPEPDSIFAAAFASGMAAAFDKGINIEKITEIIISHLPDRDLVYWDNRKYKNPRKLCEKAQKIGLKFRGRFADVRKEIYHELLQWHPIDPGEVLSITICLLLVTDGDYREGLIAGTNIGRDSDTISALIGYVTGAIHGRSAIPEEWIEGVKETAPSVYRKYEDMAERMALVVYERIKKMSEICNRFSETFGRKELCGKYRRE